jgi:cysteine dioxygenase
MQRSIVDIWRDIDECAKKSEELGAEKLCQQLIKFMTEPKQITGWEEYALLDSNKYTRNLINPNCPPFGSGEVAHELPFHLVLLAWNPGQSSSIHDHANSECCMRVLSGSLCEELYEIEDFKTSSNCIVTLRKTVNLQTGEWTSIKDSIGWHRVLNPSKPEPAFSLHLYYPPICRYRVICPTLKNTISERICRFHSINGKRCELN